VDLPDSSGVMSKAFPLSGPLSLSMLRKLVSTQQVDLRRSQSQPNRFLSPICFYYFRSGKLTWSYWFSTPDYGGCSNNRTCRFAGAALFCCQSRLPRDIFCLFPHRYYRLRPVRRITDPCHTFLVSSCCTLSGTICTSTLNRSTIWITLSAAQWVVAPSFLIDVSVALPRYRVAHFTASASQSKRTNRLKPISDIWYS